MPQITGNLRVMTGAPHLVREVWVRAESPRAGTGGSLTTDANTRIEVSPDGAVSFSAAPGPAVLVLLERTPGVDHVTQRTVKIMVTSTSSTLADVVAAGKTYDGGDPDRIGALAEKIAGYKAAAEAALAAAQQAASTAVTAVNERVGDGAVRLKHLHEEVKTLINSKVAKSDFNPVRAATRQAGDIVAAYDDAGNVSVPTADDSTPLWAAVNRRYVDVGLAAKVNAADFNPVRTASRSPGDVVAAGDGGLVAVPDISGSSPGTSAANRTYVDSAVGALSTELGVNDIAWEYLPTTSSNPRIAAVRAWRIVHLRIHLCPLTDIDTWELPVKYRPS
ncbi:hypothetical protein M0E81_11750, partial [Corynebacterium sp. CCM 9187]|nr:hypothetical protein [Corynebacterium pygosceleis]